MQNKKLIKIIGMTTLMLIPNEIQNKDFSYYKINYKPKTETITSNRPKQNHEEEISDINFRINKTYRKINFLDERIHDSTYSSKTKENYYSKIRNYQNEIKILKQKKYSLEKF